MAMKSFNLRLPPPVHTAVQQRAWLEQVSMTAWIVRAIQAALEHRSWPEGQVEISVPRILARHLMDVLTVKQREELVQELRDGR